ncbi:outer membrane beta-barrel protein [Taibaiella chishuiensis]|uniref:Outer membrane protein with beta-barrel domain n=1 Tax=Taibaiella chishuiensis TaxID=1434707 RepID=A0A2P8CWC5_9BACT|nr:outer membrane beta-barrel protein [Taibaiella chishuiensis]PSK89229.1 outer membrane protein with beta-barrel domain [Taibaiella chishuiensis]
MKHLSALLLTGLALSPAYAQNGFYTSGSVGAGLSNFGNPVYIASTAYEMTPDRSPVLSGNFQLGLGYQYKHWRFQTGLQYIRSGFRVHGVNFGSDSYFGPSTIRGEGSYKLTFNQLAIPLQAGYAIPLSKRLTLVPYAGLLLAYTVSGNAEHQVGKEVQSTGISDAGLKDYGRFSLWGTAGMQLEYKLNNRLSLYGGPAVNYRLRTTGYGNEPGTYNLNFNLGLKIELGKGGK